MAKPNFTLCALVLPVVLACSADHAAPPIDDDGLAATAKALDLTAPLTVLLVTGHWDRTPTNFRIIALSFLADGCVQRAHDDDALREPARRCVLRARALAEQLHRVAASDMAGVAPVDGLFLSHLALVLADVDALGGDDDELLHAAIVEGLARRSLHEPTHIVSSYRTDPHRWPADQAVTLAAIARYDHAHNTRLLDGPRDAYVTLLSAHLDPETQLPFSEATGADRSSSVPRGCALSWSMVYTAEFAPDVAATWWQSYRKHFLVDVGVAVGFREWPKGREGGVNGDSGPIVAGVGAAATGLGLRASRVMGDRVLHARLRATAATVEAMAGTRDDLRAAAQLQLAAAIRFAGA